jgi:hypothetical protein
VSRLWHFLLHNLFYTGVLKRPEPWSATSMLNVVNVLLISVVMERRSPRCEGHSFHTILMNCVLDTLAVTILALKCKMFKARLKAAL